MKTILKDEQILLGRKLFISNFNKIQPTKDSKNVTGCSCWLFKSESRL